jgi:hypothetical protein
MSENKFTKIHRIIKRPKMMVYATDLKSVCFDAAIGNFRAEKGNETCRGCAFESIEEVNGDAPFCGHLGDIAPCSKGDMFACTDYGLGVGGEQVLAEDIIWIENDMEGN